MNIGKTLYKLRTEARLTQEQFAALFDVSQQSVGKWENGASTPDVEKLIRIARHFDVSLDALILGNDNRILEEMNSAKQIKPKYQTLHRWESYASNLAVEYEQCSDEGLDVEQYRDTFSAVARLPQSEIKTKLGDALFEVVASAKTRDGYTYTEPSDLASIRALRKNRPALEPVAANMEDRLHGAWMGRIVGCMLGKTVEGMRAHELVPFLKETGNYPMHRYIYRTDLNDGIVGRYKYRLSGRPYADEIDGMPVDDDTNYVVLAQEIVEKYGRDFTPFDISRTWLDLQPKDAYCTAERVAFCNFVKGFVPPESALYQNPYREWIGAQIRGDYFGYINPGNPELAAEMAWRDASISHVKNGIYGEMWVSAMLAVAATTGNIEEILLGGLAEIPHTSRLYEKITLVLDTFRAGTSEKECFDMIHALYDDTARHDWCHTIPNAMIVATALLYGKGDLARSVCMAVQTGFDTDCNGATVGSVLGMANGIESIPDYWQSPIGDTLHTSIFGVGTVSIRDRVALTLKHVQS